MHPDHRSRYLSTYRLACKLIGGALLLIALALAALVAIYAANNADVKDPMLTFTQLITARDALGVVQVALIGILAIALGNKRSQPFSTTSTIALVVLSLASFAKAAAHALLAQSMEQLVFPMSDPGKVFGLARFVDTPSIALGLLFLLLAFLFRYARELRIDTEEMA